MSAFRELYYAFVDGTTLAWCVEHAHDRDVDAAIRDAWDRAEEYESCLMITAVGGWNRFAALFPHVHAGDKLPLPSYVREAYAAPTFDDVRLLHESGRFR